MNMLRTISLFCIVGLVVLAFSGCTVSEPIYEEELDSIDLDGMNLFWQRDNLQFVADENAVLSIYVNAEKTEAGEILFDDGQDWFVLMETSQGDYPLLPRQYVQLGKVSCVVFNDFDNGNTISHVLVTVQQTAGYQIYDCVYNGNIGAFNIQPVYDAKGINFICSSP